MNRENQTQNLFRKIVTIKSHNCTDSFTCKVCGRLCTPQDAGSGHRNHLSQLPV